MADVRQIAAVNAYVEAELATADQREIAAVSAYIEAELATTGRREIAAVSAYICEVEPVPSALTCYGVAFQDEDGNTTTVDMTAAPGDRAAWDVDDHSDLHAKDISDSLPVYHMPTANRAVDDGILWDGDKWVTATMIAFAGIHVHDNTTAQTVGTGSTYAKLTHFSDNGESRNCTPDASNDQITTVKAGYYLLNCSLNFSDDTNNVEWRMAPFLDGVEYDAIHVVRKISTAGDVGSASMSGILYIGANVDVDIRGRHDNGGNVDITVEYSNLSLVLIS